MRLVQRVSQGMRRVAVLAVSVAVGVSLALAVDALASAQRSNVASNNKALARAEAARDALPDTSLMAIFSRAATSADSLPSAAANIVQQFGAASVPAALNPGQALTGQSRLAISQAGGSDGSLYLVPTDKGTLCMVWDQASYGGGCTQGFEPGTDVIFVRGTTDGIPHVWGIFRDGVTSITAVVDGEDHTVTLGENAFFYGGPTLPGKLILGLANGDSQSVDVPAIRTLVLK